MKKKLVIPLVIVAALGVAGYTITTSSGGPTVVEGNLVNVDAAGVILEGYDAVAFFTDTAPVKGNPRFRSRWQGAIYQFASAEHKSLFDTAPSRYAPQFGAYCALAVSLGRTAPIRIDTWSIVDGRLVLQHNARAVRLWNNDPSGNLRFADEYWPRVVASGGEQVDVPQRY